jgi:predicted O-methyltransferase YrrM
VNAEVQAALSRLRADAPIFHSGDVERSWCALPGTLQLLGGLVDKGQHTLEIGCGASTVLFAAAGTTHIAISPRAEEHERVRDYCRQIGVDPANVEFLTGTSDEQLPRLDPSLQLDVAFIDGDHSFPHPMLDWHYVNKHLRVGGVLLADDLPTPAVGVIGEYMIASPNWSLLESADRRAAAFRKLEHRTAYYDFVADPFNRAPSYYRFLGRREALLLGVVERANRAKARVGARYPRARRLWRYARRAGPGR